MRVSDSVITEKTRFPKTFFSSDMMSFFEKFLATIGSKLFCLFVANSSHYFVNQETATRYSTETVDGYKSDNF